MNVVFKFQLTLAIWSALCLRCLNLDWIYDIWRERNINIKHTTFNILLILNLIVHNIALHCIH